MGVGFPGSGFSCLGSFSPPKSERRKGMADGLGEIGVVGSAPSGAFVLPFLYGWLASVTSGLRMTPSLSGNIPNP